MITIVDYGMGNLRSVQKAFEKIGCATRIAQKSDDLDQCEKMVLPGVGAFRDAIHHLRRQEMVEPILNHLGSDRPFLGICLGLQLLFDVSHEDGYWEGLGVLPGSVQRFKDTPGLKVPHMGWNEVQGVNNCPLLKDIPAGTQFYFVHSYHVVPDNPNVIAGQTDYGGPFTAMIQREQMFATQFHPEKSQAWGLQLLSNFAKL